MVWPEELREHLREAMRHVAKDMAARRRQAPGRCAVCGAEFVATTRRMYCSNRCAVRAYRQRKRQQGSQAEGQGERPQGP